ncbi:hypothetical protein CC86DRAFT_367043 [Ophiobolus disseminans]|uniref:Uncharacterized protein n=1 Tax=Ophiobolus disseminans TaxID=1469910 RepID=A0A6A7AFU1_9PLEO|nr:hypothetical protein CC86DRAFT_367043 [Ophiobolus disseminans]
MSCVSHASVHVTSPCQGCGRELPTHCKSGSAKEKITETSIPKPLSRKLESNMPCHPSRITALHDMHVARSHNRRTLHRGSKEDAQADTRSESRRWEEHVHVRKFSSDEVVSCAVSAIVPVARAMSWNGDLRCTACAGLVVLEESYEQSRLIKMRTVRRVVIGGCEASRKCVFCLSASQNL